MLNDLAKNNNISRSKLTSNGMRFKLLPNEGMV